MEEGGRERRKRKNSRKWLAFSKHALDVYFALIV